MTHIVTQQFGLTIFIRFERSLIYNKGLQLERPGPEKSVLLLTILPAKLLNNNIAGNIVSNFAGNILYLLIYIGNIVD